MIRIRMRWEENAEKLAARLSEILAPMGILPVISRSQVILDNSLAGGSMNVNKVAQLAAKALLDLGIRFRGITSSGSEIIIEDEKPEGGERCGPSFFICPHCGFITPYEEEYWNHVRIHYIGF